MHNESLGLCNGFWLVWISCANALRQCSHIRSLGNEHESSVIFQLMIMCHCCTDLFALCRQCVWRWACPVLPQPSGFGPAAVTSRQSLWKRLWKIQKTSRESSQLSPLTKNIPSGKDPWPLSVKSPIWLGLSKPVSLAYIFQWGC